MKPGHKKTKSKYPHDLKSLQERVARWKQPDGPFDYAARAKAATEVRQVFSEVCRLRLQNPYDAELAGLQSRALRLVHLAIEAAYPPGFWDAFQRLQIGDATGLESAIAFLEADPMFFRTGYIKTALIRYIKPDMLGRSDTARLQAVVLSIVDRHDDRDFRAFCRLARKVDAPRLVTALTQRLMDSDANVRRRARWVLDALDAGAAQPRDLS